MKRRLAILAISTILLLGACAPATAPAPTQDVNAIYTAAAKTVVAEFTLTAAAFSPTPAEPTETETATPAAAALTTTVTVTNTALVTDPTLIALGTPGTLCDSMTFGSDVDVTIPDNSTLSPGQDFIKTWKVTNDGACTWGDGYGLIYAYGEKMNGQPVPLSGVVQPGQSVQVSVNLKAPDKAGEYTSAWQMSNAKGVSFGKALFVKIIVQ